MKDVIRRIDELYNKNILKAFDGLTMGFEVLAELQYTQASFARSV